MLRMTMMSLAAVALLWPRPAKACEQEHVVTLEKIYDQLYDAAAKHNLPKVMSFIDPDFLFIDSEGHNQSAAQYRAGIENAFSKMQNTRVTYKLKDVQSKDGKLEAYLQQDERFDIYDENSKQWVGYNSTATLESLWQKKGDLWTLIKTKELRRGTTVDPEWLQRQKEKAKHLADLARTSCNSCCP